MSPLERYLSNHPTRVCAIVLATILPIVWMMAPGNGVFP